METIMIIALVLGIISGLSLSFIGGYFLGKYKGKEEKEEELKRLEELCSSVNKTDQ